MYLNALKLYSQSSNFYDAAKDVYKKLFQFEIFIYSESLFKTQRIENYDTIEKLKDEFEDNLFSTIVIIVSNIDIVLNNLSQILYFVYKNYNQF